MSKTGAYVLSVHQTCVKTLSLKYSELGPRELFTWEVLLTKVHHIQIYIYIFKFNFHITNKYTPFKCFSCIENYTHHYLNQNNRIPLSLKVSSRFFSVNFPPSSPLLLLSSNISRVARMWTSSLLRCWHGRCQPSLFSHISARWRVTGLLTTRQISDSLLF